MVSAPSQLQTGGSWQALISFLSYRVSVQDFKIIFKILLHSLFAMLFPHIACFFSFLEMWKASFHSFPLDFKQCYVALAVVLSVSIPSHWKPGPPLRSLQIHCGLRVLLVLLASLFMMLGSGAFRLSQHE